MSYSECECGGRKGKDSAYCQYCREAYDYLWMRGDNFLFDVFDNMMDNPSFIETSAKMGFSRAKFSLILKILELPVGKKPWERMEAQRQEMVRNDPMFKKFKEIQRHE